MNTQKKILLLGGLSYLLPIIREAHKKGVFVITADYLPNNIAHKFSDQYINVSIIDKEKVLELARNLNIDGIMSHAVDPGVTTAAYVAEKMGLPFQCSYQASCILQNKDLFRRFLRNHNFNVPQSRGYTNLQQALFESKSFTYPVIVKPVDSAGSKGVTRVDHGNDLENALTKAMSLSISKRIIMEEYIESMGHPFGSESFAVDGKLVYNGFYDQIFDYESANPYVPTTEIWPSSMHEEYINQAKQELQRLFNLLEVKTGLFNIECRVGRDKKLYIMEVSPRGGGNRLSEILGLATDINILEAETGRALNLDIGEIHEPNYNGHYAIVVVRSHKEGILKSIKFDEAFRNKHILDIQICVENGDYIKTFASANTSLGTIFLRFDSREELNNAILNQHTWLSIDVE